MNIQRVYEVLTELNKLSNKELAVISKALFFMSENRFDDGEWRTLENGVHIQIGENGAVEKGPSVLKGKKPGEKLGASQKANDTRLQPKNADYDWEYGDGINDFIRKNVDKLKPIYEENSRSGVEDEYYKFRTAATTENLKEMSHEEAQEILDSSIRPGIWQGWFQEADQDFKPKLVDAMLKNSETRSAALSNMYYLSKSLAEANGEEVKPFEEWLYTPIKLYRGGTGKEYDKPALFSAYSLDRKIAEKFANSENSTQIYEMEIRPIDTWGSARTKGEAEVEVPSFVAVNGNRDSREDAEEDGVWRTLNNGVHVFINGEGEIEKGPDVLEGENVKNKSGTGKKTSAAAKLKEKNDAIKSLRERAINCESSEDFEARLSELNDLLEDLPKGTQITFPEDEWRGKRIYTYEGKDNWTGKGVWTSKNRSAKELGEEELSSSHIADYLVDPDGENIAITKIPKQGQIDTRYSDGELRPDNHINDHVNPHVTEARREKFREAVAKARTTRPTWNFGHSQEAVHVGKSVAQEVMSRFKMKVNAGETESEEPQTEDIYEALRDLRSFGPPEGFEPRIYPPRDMPISKEKLEDLTREALSRFPTDWFLDGMNPPSISFEDVCGRACCRNGGAIEVFLVVTLPDGHYEKKSDRQIVGELAHELGHYFEAQNETVARTAHDYLYERTKGCDTYDLYSGEAVYDDGFAHPYTGRLYVDDSYLLYPSKCCSTEITSTFVEYLSGGDPVSNITKGSTSFALSPEEKKKKGDVESLYYILGMLAGYEPKEDSANGN